MRKLVLLAVLASAAPARADGELHASLAVDGSIALIGTEFLVKDTLAPETCRWCEVNGLDDGVRDALKWNDTTAAH